MTKKSLRNNFAGAIMAFVGLFIIGLVIGLLDGTPNRIAFSTFKDLLPLFLGMAAAWLGLCVQRRSAYQQQLRTLWSKLVEGVQAATQYTHLVKPTQADYGNTLLKLSIAIDEIRGVFCNLGEGGCDLGLYPFEPIKDIYNLISGLDCEALFDSMRAATVRGQIFALWKDVRPEILREFDREEPTFAHSHWADRNKSRVYDEHQIPKSAS